MFLDIVDSCKIQQQPHISDQNECQIELQTDKTLQLEKMESSSDEQNQKPFMLNMCKSQTGSHFKNSNLMKNILKSFQRYIENEVNEQQKNFFCNLSKIPYSYAQMCKFLKCSLKTEGKRWNMKARHLVEKSKFKPLFKYYLIHINKLWLDNSKVTNKEEHQVLANFLLNQIKNPDDCVTNAIHLSLCTDKAQYYDISNRKSFENALLWYYDYCFNRCDNLIILALIGNKCDLKNQRQVSQQEAQQLAESLGILFFEVSAKTGYQVNELFESLINKALYINKD
ncbi:hypothetical protein ABPG72_000398 [Tetrahymena utriculariae]